MNKEYARSAEKPRSIKTRSTLPPKSSAKYENKSQTPKVKSFEKSYDANAYFPYNPTSPLSSTSTLARTPNRSLVSSPLRKSSPIRDKNDSENSLLDKFYTYETNVTESDEPISQFKFKRLETENLRLKNENSHNKEIIFELRGRIDLLRKNDREKDQKLSEMSLMLKESEKRLRNLLETHDTKPDYLAVKKDEIIRDLEFKLKMQKRELIETFDREKKEFELELLEFESLYDEKYKNVPIEDLNIKIKALEETVLKLESENKDLKCALYNSPIQTISRISAQIEADVTQLSQILRIIVTEQEISLAMVLLAAQAHINQNPSMQSIMPSLENTSKLIEEIRNSISDLYAERCGGYCKLQ